MALVLYKVEISNHLDDTCYYKIIALNDTDDVKNAIDNLSIGLYAERFCDTEFITNYYQVRFNDIEIYSDTEEGYNVVHEKLRVLFE